MQAIKVKVEAGRNTLSVVAYFITDFGFQLAVGAGATRMLPSHL